MFYYGSTGPTAIHKRRQRSTLPKEKTIYIIVVSPTIHRKVGKNLHDECTLIKICDGIFFHRRHELKLKRFSEARYIFFYIERHTKSFEQINLWWTRSLQLFPRAYPDGNRPRSLVWISKSGTRLSDIGTNQFSHRWRSLAALWLRKIYRPCYGLGASLHPSCENFRSGQVQTERKARARERGRLRVSWTRTHNEGLDELFIRSISRHEDGERWHFSLTHSPLARSRPHVLSVRFLFAIKHTRNIFAHAFSIDRTFIKVNFEISTFKRRFRIIHWPLGAKFSLSLILCIKIINFLLVHQ